MRFFKWALIVGAGSFVANGLAALTLFGAMQAGLLQFGPPPSWLWIWLIGSAWLIVVGGVPFFVRLVLEP